MSLDRAREILTFIGEGRKRWSELEKEFKVRRGWPKQTFVKYLKRLQKEGKVGKKPMEGRFYYVVNEGYEELVERIRVTNALEKSRKIEVSGRMAKKIVQEFRDSIKKSRLDPDLKRIVQDNAVRIAENLLMTLGVFVVGARVDEIREKDVAKAFMTILRPMLSTAFWEDYRASEPIVTVIAFGFTWGPLPVNVT